MFFYYIFVLSLFLQGTLNAADSQQIHESMRAELLARALTPAGGAAGRIPTPARLPAPATPHSASPVNYSFGAGAVPGPMFSAVYFFPPLMRLPMQATLPQSVPVSGVKSETVEPVESKVRTSVRRADAGMKVMRHREKRAERVMGGLPCSFVDEDGNRCTSTFTTKWNLTRHELIHSGEKEFKCNKCPKEFTLKHHLVNHERTHTGKKPFECGNCKKRFADSGNCRKHERIHVREAAKQLLEFSNPS